MRLGVLETVPEGLAVSALPFLVTALVLVGLFRSGWLDGGRA